MRDGKEMQKVCEDQDSALRWLQAEMRPGDVFVCIESEHMNARRLSLTSKGTEVNKTPRHDD
jgi:hypothetical protein